MGPRTAAIVRGANYKAVHEGNSDKINRSCLLNLIILSHAFNGEFKNVVFRFDTLENDLYEIKNVNFMRVDHKMIIMKCELSVNHGTFANGCFTYEFMNRKFYQARYVKDYSRRRIRELKPRVENTDDIRRMLEFLKEYLDASELYLKLVAEAYPKHNF